MIITTDKEREDLRRLLQSRIKNGIGAHSDRLALAVLEERGNLAAQVVWLNSAGQALYRELEAWKLTEEDPESIAAMAKWRRIRNQESEALLARLIADKQRDAYLAGWMDSGEGYNGELPGDAHEWPEWLEKREEWIRRQAEEGDYDAAE